MASLWSLCLQALIFAVLCILVTPDARHLRLVDDLASATLGMRDGAFRSSTIGQLQVPTSYSVRKSALVVGVNGGNATGCILDANEMRADLIRTGYLSQDIILLENATQFVLLKSMTELVSSLYAGDRGFFYFSGHGGTTFDLNRDEPPGRNDSFLATTTKDILDDEIHAKLIRPLRFGVQLFGVIDACRSGTIFDLPFEYNEISGLWTSRAGRRTQEINCSHPQLPEVFETQAILLAACRDDEDTGFLKEDMKRGAFTVALRRLLSSGKSMTFLEILLRMNYNPLHVHVQNKTYYKPHVQLSALNCFDVSRKLFRF